MEKRNDISVLMIIGLFYPVVGGAEKVCQRLSKKLIDKGISVTVLTQQRDGLPGYEVIDGIPVYRKMKGWHPFGLLYMISVLSFLLKQRRKFDIIQCFGMFIFVPPVLLMKYLFRKKVVLRLLCSGQFGDFWWIKQLKLKKLVIAASKRFDRIIFLSSDMKKELLRNGFPVEKLLYIANGVDVDFFKPPESDEGSKGKNICCVGRLDKQKGLEYLIRSIDIIRSKENGVKLFIVGEGKQRATLEDLCRKLELRSHIVFVGITDDVRRYYHNAKIFVLPSVSEGMSSSLLEAMSCGLPVVATLVGGNREIVESRLASGKELVSHYQLSENGVLVKPGDDKGLAEALLKLLKDEGLSNQLGENARKLVESRFSQGKVVDDYKKLYDNLQ